MSSGDYDGCASFVFDKVAAAYGYVSLGTESNILCLKNNKDGFQNKSPASS